MQSEIINQLYGGEVFISFYPKSHRYKLIKENKWLPSVTSYTNVIDKSGALVNWAISLFRDHLQNILESGKTIDELEIEYGANLHAKTKKQAATIGDMVHKFAFDVAKGIKQQKMPSFKDYAIEGNDDGTEKVYKAISAFAEWVIENEVSFLDAERLVYSKEYGYVGTLDVIIKINDKIYIGDYKTSKNIYPEMRYQLAAYWQAYEEENGEVLDGGVIIHFNKDDGTFKTLEIDREDYQKDFKAFLACREIVERNKELKTNQK